ncbi:hypothetical protein [Streptomyces graminilatus]|uniref:hypothetical protein n=1 Tax=Streptomyces graminilatus TaxID=1464070 RepID=UPI0006E18198|nr:hypothetical protein [Streptomyces graminilatus]
MSVTAEDIGRYVQDASGRSGVLRDVIPDYEDPAEPPGERRRFPVAFLWPEGGGKEWLELDAAGIDPARFGLPV